jgi:hypothetical protein
MSTPLGFYEPDAVLVIQPGQVARGAAQLRDALEGFAALEPTLESEVQHVIQGSNLVQRDPKFRELRFYRVVRGRVDRSELPELPVKPGEVKLLSMAVRVPDRAEPLHAVLWAVDRRVTMLNFDPGIHAYQHLASASVEGVRQSWRSNVVGGGA